MIQPSQNLTSSFDWPFYLSFTGMVVIVPLVFSTEVVSVAYTTKFLAFQTTLSCLYLVYILKWKSTNFYPLGTSPLTLPIGLYLAVTLFSILQAVNPVEAIFQLSHQVSLTFLFIILFTRIRSHELHQYLKPIACIGTLLSLIGILQYLGYNLLQQIPSAGMPSATLGYRNYAAMTLLLTIPVGLFLFLDAPRVWEIRVWGGSIALMCTFLIYTRTRGAWIGLIGACLIILITILFLNRRQFLPKKQNKDLVNHRIYTIISASVVVLILSFLPPRMGEIGFEHQRPEKLEITQTITSMLTPEGDKSRILLWENTWKMIQDHPLFGVGTGNWQSIYPSYDKGKVITSTALPRRPHNDFLWITSELGLPGILSFLWILGVALLRSLHLASSAKTHRDFYIPICLGLAILSIMGQALFSFPRERITPSVFFWSTLAFIAVLDAKQYQPLPLRRTEKILHLGGITLVTLCLLIGARAFTFDRHYALAITYANQNHWDKTIEETTSALSQGIFDPQILLFRGLAYTTLGNYTAAVEDNQKCLVYRPSFVNALNNLGISYNSLKEHDKALKTLNRILKINPDHSEVHANLGTAYLGLKRYEEAILEFKLALSRHPFNSELRYQLATVYELQGNPDQASEHYTRILGNDFQHAGAHYRLAVINQNQGFYDKAIHELNQTLQVDPTYLPTHFSLGEIYALQRDTTKAINSYKNFLKFWKGDHKISQLVNGRIRMLSK